VGIVDKLHNKSTDKQQKLYQNISGVVGDKTLIKSAIEIPT